VDAFRLYDTYGFPIDLTEDIAAEQGLSTDREGFEQALDEQRARARAARKNVKSMSAQTAIWEGLANSSQFVGYDEKVTEARILRLVLGGEVVESAQEGDEVQFVLDRTPFYAESGGQVADRGIVSVMEAAQLQVVNVQKIAGGLHVHFANVISGEVRSGATAQASIDSKNRMEITRNHTATHLLHKALREVLGDHVAQAGSLVEAERLRFDFSHLSAMTKEEIRAVERKVNEQIWTGQQVETRVLPIEQAKQLGAMALFGEKYGDQVRVVSAGDYSIELCGGCHVTSTDEIGQFRIVSESSIASGVRRIEAVTGKGAYQYALEQNQLLEEMATKLKASVRDLPVRVDGLQVQVRDANKEIESLRAKMAGYEVKQLLGQVQYAGKTPFIAAELSGLDMDGLRAVAEDLRGRMKSGVIVLGGVHDDKVSFVAAVTKDLIANGYQAGKIVKSVAAIAGGGGGGRPELAQAGGKDPGKVAEALASVAEVLA
ncbi:MAG: alanine--tRNA ligase, partial [Bacilli bacterium]|nr:alanine--tRNA ligase [Bacilli bacterium]